jgi:Cyclic nucleotide-binding domain/Major Facilitator Superfamily
MPMLGAAALLTLPGDPRLRRVLVAYGLSRFTEFAGWLAILLVAYAEGGALLVGIASFAMQLPAIVLVPLLAGFVDRLPRGRALTLTHAGVAVCAGATGVLLFLAAPLWVVLIGGTATTVAVFSVRPSHFSTLPLLAKGPGDLVSANGWSSFMDGAAIFIGFLLAGVLTDEFGAWVVLALCALLGVVATLLTSGLHTPVVGTGHADAPGELRAALEGLATLRRSAGALALLLLMACTSVIQGSNETLTVTFNDEVLGLPESTAGLLAGAYGVGIALGGITLAGLAQRSSLAPVVLAGALLLGLAQAAVALLGSLVAVVIMLMLVGVGMAMIMVSARTLLQRTTDDGVLARVLAVQEGVHLTGLTIGALVGPLVIALFGPSAAFVPGALLILGIGLLAGRSIHQLDAVAVDHSREVSLLGRVPFLAALPPYELERLAQGAEWVSVPAGTDVVTQGDDADSYYLVAAGELSVAIDGVRRAQTMVAGDGFGEIALLNRVARTATVTALQDCELLVVSSGDFLGAVTATPDGEGLAHEISRARLEFDRQGR